MSNTEPSHAVLFCYKQCSLKTKNPDHFLRQKCFAVPNSTQRWSGKLAIIERGKHNNDLNWEETLHIFLSQKAFVVFHSFVHKERDRNRNRINVKTFKDVQTLPTSWTMCCRLMLLLCVLTKTTTTTGMDVLKRIVKLAGVCCPSVSTDMRTCCFQ